jgi:ABC-2 type transport system ATP-binding protein
MNKLAIDVTGLSKHFGNKVAVDSIDIHMPKGQVWGFLGPNGSGKTTTIRMICGLLQPTAGKGTCLGFDILSDSEKIKRITGYMTQKFSFWGDLTIRENLAFVARLYNLPNVRKTVADTVAKLGLSDRQHQLADSLSGGWKQRLALAAVTMPRPELLLLDEPTAGVDPQARREFWDEIHRLSLNGLTVLVSTHYMDEAERCDEIVYLANGQLIAQGQVKDIIQESGLSTYRGEGRGVRELAETLKKEPDVEHVAYFGAALHVSSRNLAAIKTALSKHQQSDIQWRQVTPGLEDAFIALMARAGSDRRQS